MIPSYSMTSSPYSIVQGAALCRPREIASSTTTKRSGSVETRTTPTGMDNSAEVPAYTPTAPVQYALHGRWVAAAHTIHTTSRRTRSKNFYKSTKAEYTGSCFSRRFSNRRRTACIASNTPKQSAKLHILLENRAICRVRPTTIRPRLSRCVKDDFSVLVNSDN